MKTPEKQIVIVPKGAVTEGKDSRNSLTSLLVRAGYQNVVDGFASKKNRNDQVDGGEFTFRAVKGAGAVAAQLELYRGQPIALLMGSDVLGEADLQAQLYGVRSDISRLLTLNEGVCSLRFLVPNEQPVNDASDIDRRVLFTKYPRLLERVLQVTGRNALVRRVEGADTRVNEFRSSQRSTEGAFEIVGSGDTARANNLQIVGNQFPYPSGSEMGLPYVDLYDISTDLFITNATTVRGDSRRRLQELGLALESARTTNMRIPVIMNVRQDLLPQFSDLGIKGPSVKQVLSKDGIPRVALEILVSPDDQNATRLLLIQKGAEDIAFGEPINVEPSAAGSEVLRVLPLRIEDDTIEITDTRDGEIASWMLGLRTTIQNRALNPDKKSGTTKALDKGLEFCVARYVNEAVELSGAIRSGNTQNALDEAGQCVYWFLVSLQSRGISLTDLIPTQEGQEAQDALLEFVKSIRASVRTQDSLSRNEMASFLDAGVTGASMQYIDQATQFSTAMRKGEIQNGSASALEALKYLISLVELAGINFDAVMDKEKSGA